MADIVRLRVAGFKSFVDPVEIAIPPGLTGIVGPNGCGKSNVVEALRWAMGETSAKQLRGGGMEDVIFAGAAGRPARNNAEVAISLTDPDGRFPTPWVGQSDLEIARRIERGGGSNYRVNGREARARDVQTLFADLASGARSAAIVSQGQIGAFVVAKPEQRRAILEEAAGVAGLRARRHEATLRLNAAEANLERLDDVLLGFDNQLSGLRKQARQASRFRKLTDLIRAAEACAFIARLRLAEAKAAKTAEDARAAEARVAEAATAAAAAERLATEATTALPARRREESEAAARQQRLRIELERIESERRRRADAKAAAQQRLEDVGRDRAREADRQAAAAEALERLAAEAAELASAAQQLDDPAALDGRIEQLAAAAAERLAAANAAADRAAEIEAAGRAAAQRRADAEARSGRADAAAAAAARALAEASAAAPDPGLKAAAAAAAEAARALLETRQAEAEAARTAAEAARAEADGLSGADASARQAEAALAAEAKTLAGLLARPDGADAPPALDYVRAVDGYETALAAALGDDLEAALDSSAPAFWSGRFGGWTGSTLPDGARPLSDFVTAPDELAARLSEIGVVEDAAAGEALSDDLAMGQRLVSRAGDLWRWDGFRRRAGAETAAARRLAMQNRLEALEGSLGEARAAMAAAAEAAAGAKARAQAAAAAEQAARAAVGEARRALESETAAAGKAERAEAAHAAGIAAKTEASTLAEAQAAEARKAFEEAATALAGAADAGAAKAEAEALRADAGAAQFALAEARGERQRLEAAKAANAGRRRAVEQEQTQWRAQAGAAAEAIEALAERSKAAEDAIAAADAGDAGEETGRAELLDALEVAEAQRRTLADALARAESEATARAAEARTAESAAGAAREARVGAQALAAEARGAVGMLVERLAERLDAAPADLAEIAGVDPDTIGDDLEPLDRRVERLRRERETMGAVNLRAEAEIEELETQSETIRTERADLEAAIAKLRRGVADLAGEARMRLRAAFDKIDREFGKIFQTLFGGGRARLALTGSDDPLEAGLEIMASPPGKSLQTLSLLSGGERALTAMALVFAAFRANPSPICVLDEVDAPLDDSNVDRVCALLEEIAAEGRTRFLVVTHHRMTMARMHRLYGVTMPDQGVSQLVSVDFDAAQAMREAG